MRQRSTKIYAYQNAPYRTYTRKKEAVADKQKTDGELHRFDSKTEYRRWLILLEDEKDGKIIDLKVHPVYVLGERTGVKWTADFSYIEKGKGRVVEDVKGWNQKKDKPIIQAGAKWAHKWFKEKYGLAMELRITTA